MALDLNKPKDAKRYIQSWVDRGELRIGTRSLPLTIEEGTPDDYLRVAFQLFVYCDDRPPLNLGELH